MAESAFASRFRLADEAQQAWAEAKLLALLPQPDGVLASCSEVALIENSSGRWLPMHVFGLCSPVRNKP